MEPNLAQFNKIIERGFFEKNQQDKAMKASEGNLGKRKSGGLGIR